MLGAVTPASKPAIPERGEETQGVRVLGRRALTLTQLVVLVGVVGIATAAVLAAAIGALLAAARELQ